MVPHATLSAAIDIAFVVLVSGCCFATLFGGRRSDNGRESWKSELRELEHVLRELIAEASTASNNLDRTLARRKQELESVLNKLEERDIERPLTPPLETAPQEMVPQEMVPRETVQYREAVQPRESARARPSRTAPAVPIARAWSHDPGDRFRYAAGADHEERSLVALAGERTDRVSIGRSAPAEPKPRASARVPGLRAQQEPPLSPDVEWLEDEQLRRTYEQTSIIDPVAYRIARRLLAGGKEIHVVARKLDLPLSEVRLLDKLMRQETRDVPSAGELKPANAYERFNTPGAAPADDAQLESAIAAEIALL